MSDRPTNTRRELITVSTLGAGALLALALLAIVNYFGWKYHQRFDWTSSRLYTLSEKSVNVLESLDRDIEAVVFLSPGDVEMFGPTIELLSRYEALSQRFSFRTLDPERNPAAAQELVNQYGVSSLNVVVFDSGDDRRVVESSDMAEFDYSGMQYGQGPTLESFKGEQAFTAAILELVEDVKPRILFTSGHGEAELDDVSGRGLSTAQDLLGRDNFELDSWASLGQSSVPEGTDLLVIAGPTSGFLEPEVEVLRSYLQSGGRLLALLDPVLTDLGTLSGSGLDALLLEYGVQLGADLVVDPANPLPFFSAETFFVTQFGDHQITRALSQAQLPVIFALAGSVSGGPAPEGFEVTELLRTSAEGWGETDLQNLQSVALDEDDLAGPVPLGVAIEAAAADDPQGAGDEGAPEPQSAPPIRFVVIGDSDFATNTQLPNVGNPELLANTMNWLVEREALLGISPKEPEQVRLSLTEGQLRWVNLLVLALMPGLALALGAAVYFRRRR